MTKEFQLTAKSLERQRRAEEGAEGTLQDFLDSNYKAVRAMIMKLTYICLLT